jgi:hypothetical protein
MIWVGRPWQGSLLLLLLQLESLAVSLPKCSAQWCKSFAASQPTSPANLVPSDSSSAVLGRLGLQPKWTSSGRRQAHSEVERKNSQQPPSATKPRKNERKAIVAATTTFTLPSPGQLDRRILILDLQQWTECTSGPESSGATY